MSRWPPSFFDPEDIRGALLDQFRNLLGDQGAEALKTMLASADQSARGIFASLMSLLLLLFTATSTLGTLRLALNRTFEVQAASEPSWSDFIRTRAAALALIGAIGFLLVTSLVREHDDQRARGMDVHAAAGR